jgi:SHS2 domain-containing protein
MERVKMFETFEHRADIGVRGKGKTLNESFQEIAKAMFSVEISIKRVKKSKKVKIRCFAQNSEELLVEWLNALLAESSVKNMMFSEFKVNIKEQDGKLNLDGLAYGEKFDEKKHEPKLEIKAATYSQLKVFKDEKTKEWVVQCIVDV